jgi:hypothetical protein
MRAAPTHCPMRSRNCSASLCVYIHARPSVRVTGERRSYSCRRVSYRAAASASRASRRTDRLGRTLDVASPSAPGMAAERTERDTAAPRLAARAPALPAAAAAVAAESAEVDARAPTTNTLAAVKCNRHAVVHQHEMQCQ